MSQAPLNPQAAIHACTRDLSLPAHEVVII